MSLCTLDLFKWESVVEGRSVPTERDLVPIVRLLVAL